MKKIALLLILSFILLAATTTMTPKPKQGDPTKGKEVFMAQCASCHYDYNGGGTGPFLNEVVDRHIAAMPEFSYSSALQSKSKLIWNQSNLLKWITSPRGFAPGNKMGFSGVEKNSDRLDIYAYLTTLK